jgi:hypothetical protein
MAQFSPLVRTARKNLRSAGRNLNSMLPGHSALPSRSSFLPRNQAATGGLALGALAGGAMALGALAIARLAIGKMAVGHAHLGKLEVDDLTVHRLRIVDGAESWSPIGEASGRSLEAEPPAATSSAETEASATSKRSTRKRNGPEQPSELQQSTSKGG